VVKEGQSALIRIDLRQGQLSTRVMEKEQGGLLSAPRGPTEAEEQDHPGSHGLTFQNH